MYLRWMPKDILNFFKKKLALKANLSVESLKLLSVQIPSYIKLRSLHYFSKIRSEKPLKLSHQLS